MIQPKVIGLGFHKTGTTTLGECLKTLGYNHISCNREAFLLYHSGEIPALLRLMEFFDSFEDWPWPFIYKEAYERFPGSKFILTTRATDEIWYQSLTKHVDRKAGGQFFYRKYIYGYDDPAENKEHHLRLYREHNAAVREFFADKKEVFLEVCWENGDDWEKLCTFLGKEPVNAPLPHANRAPEKRRKSASLLHRIRKAAHVLARG